MEGGEDRGAGEAVEAGVGDAFEDRRDNPVVEVGVGEAVARRGGGPVLGGEAGLEA